MTACTNSQPGSVVGQLEQGQIRRPLVDHGAVLAFGGGDQVGSTVFRDTLALFLMRGQRRISTAAGLGSRSRSA
jgi:hypothetical protein